ncbi:hypothetical protein BZA05DRAFT_436375 [Tricharina praecox]|uniref:uncharacterized protein n=1 Tax=Tricharina praecox TaxID=43433 RepID=UPI0022203D92|nr:uncharacterized protein BZA05DRAFT_436375 [Tricharina praecox]KAI5851974.1 hypothetical protein BZA05DRAFT_436375 [Tricharina praecox]
MVAPAAVLLVVVVVVMVLVVVLVVVVVGCAGAGAGCWWHQTASGRNRKQTLLCATDGYTGICAPMDSWTPGLLDYWTPGGVFPTLRCSLITTYPASKDLDSSDDIIRSIKWTIERKIKWAIVPFANYRVMMLVTMLVLMLDNRPKRL